MRRKVSYVARKENRAKNAAFRDSGLYRDPVRVLSIENDPLGAVAEVRVDPAMCKSSDIKRVPKLV